jgi:hypothetical protein
MNLRVGVNDDLVLDAGAIEVLGSELVIHPPSVTLFNQVLDYLSGKPETARQEPAVEDEGIASTAVALRWGSYLAVLSDGSKPIWAEARSPGVSRISDSEMARINIEASSALAEWIDIARTDRDTYEKLVAKAVAYLPLPKMRPTPAGSEFAMLALPDVAATMITGVDSDHLARVRDDAEKHASRIFTNALVNVAWRNGPAEDLHAGHSRGHRSTTAVSRRPRSARCSTSPPTG